MQRPGSKKPIQNITFKKWSKVGLCTMSLGRENMITSIRSPLSLHILPIGFLLWLWKSKKILVLSYQVQIMESLQSGRDRI